METTLASVPLRARPIADRGDILPDTNSAPHVIYRARRNYVTRRPVRTRRRLRRPFRIAAGALAIVAPTFGLFSTLVQQRAFMLPRSQHDVNSAPTGLETREPVWMPSPSLSIAPFESPAPVVEIAVRPTGILLPDDGSEETTHARSRD